MSRKDLSRRDYETLRHYDRMMRNKKRNCSGVPGSCRRCPYYQKDWKYRRCTFTTCLYGKDVKIFRNKPLKHDRFAKTR